MKQCVKHVCITVGLSLIATACSTVNPYTQEKQTSKAVKGASIGAALGAVAGLLTRGDKLDNALIENETGGRGDPRPTGRLRLRGGDSEPGL